MTARRSRQQRDIAPPEMIDQVRAIIDAAQIPCPDCGKPMVSARAYSAQAGAVIGAACTACQKCYEVEPADDDS